jgi:hypothetical protein
VLNRFPSAARRVLVLAAVAVTAASCTGATIVKDYGPEAKQNFVNACEQDISVVNHEIEREKLAPRPTCVCVYTAMKDEFRLPWDDLAEYEKEVAAAPDGEAPEMPPQLRKAVAKCTTAGPSVPAATTTTEAG